MVKSRKGYKPKSSKSTVRKQEKTKRNPFEFKFNRVKKGNFNANEKSVQSGNPSLSKKTAFEKRKNTLGVEWKQSKKANKIVDHRYAENNKHIDTENRIIKRFTAERLKFFKNNKFQLTEEEEPLTHKGSLLTSIQKYDRNLSDEDDEEAGTGDISADMVATAHFGGGYKPEDKTQAESKRHDVINKLISKTRQMRYDKQLARDKQKNMSEEIDEEWRKLSSSGMFNSLIKVNEEKKKYEERSARKIDNYDNILHELKMDGGRRVKAEERTKTEQELAFIERSKLEALEADRIKRMDLPSNKSIVDTMNSLGPEIEAEKKNKELKKFVVSYDESGNLINANKIETERRKHSESESSEESIESLSLEDDEQDPDLIFNENVVSGNENLTNELKKEKSSVIATSSDLPYVYDMPKSYEEFKKFFHNKSSSDYLIIIERLIKCHHPSLKEGNKARLNKIFVYLLRYFDELANNIKEFDKLRPISRGLFGLLKFDADYGARCLRALIKHQYKITSEFRREIFGFRTVALIKLVSDLFPVADSYHPVCTPTLLFASKLIANIHIKRLKDAARMLILIEVLLEYIRETRRYMPEMVAFVTGILFTAVENINEEFPFIATFPSSFPQRKMLYVEVPSGEICDNRVFSINLHELFDEENDSFDDGYYNRLCILNITFGIIKELTNIYSSHTETFQAIFAPIKSFLNQLPKERYPDSLNVKLLDLQTTLDDYSKSVVSLMRLQKPKQQKKILELLEPRIESVRDIKENKISKKKDISRRYKREMRSAIRELRRDNQFLSRQKRGEMLENDRERRLKTKALINSLEGQQSEHNRSLFKKKYLID